MDLMHGPGVGPHAFSLLAPLSIDTSSYRCFLPNLAGFTANIDPRGQQLIVGCGSKNHAQGLFQSFGPSVKRISGRRAPLPPRPSPPINIFTQTI